MPAKGPVKIVWQIIFIFIPVLDLWAFYRIKKLRRFALMVWIPETIITMIIIIPIVAGDVDQILNGNPMQDNESILTTILLYVVETGFAILSIYLIYKWSKEWNRQFTNTSNANP